MTPGTSLSQFMGAVRNEAAVARAEGLEMEVLAQFDQSVSVWVREGASLGQLFTWMESPVRIVFLESTFCLLLLSGLVCRALHCSCRSFERLVDLHILYFTCIYRLVSFMESRTCAYDVYCDIQHGTHFVDFLHGTPFVAILA